MKSVVLVTNKGTEMTIKKIVQPEPKTTEELQATVLALQSMVLALQPMVLALQQEIAKLKKDVTWIIHKSY